MNLVIFWASRENMRPRLTVLATVLLSLSRGAVSVEPFAYSCVQCKTVSVITAADRAKFAVKTLQDSLRSNIGEGTIRGCSVLIGEAFGGGFTAFGGNCDVTFGGKTSKWMLCADDGVGNFAAVAGARWGQNPRQFIAQFTDSNCVGG
jgi:hypothetical protein